MRFLGHTVRLPNLMELCVNPSLTCADRSFNYGDGIFTTMQVKAGEIQLWPLHLARLQLAAKRLMFGDIDWLAVQQQALAAITAPSQVVKIVISRGIGGRGYSPADVTGPVVYVSVSAMPDYQQWRRSGVTLGLAPLKLAVQPLLAGMKHTNRLEQVLIKQQLASTTFDDVLVVDQQNFVTEVSAANIFFYRNGHWYTPELSRAGVDGVMRQYIMQHIDVQQVNWELTAMAEVESMFICNALMEIVPVRQYLQRAMDMAVVTRLAGQII